MSHPRLMSKPEGEGSGLESEDVLDFLKDLAEALGEVGAGILDFIDTAMLYVLSGVALLEAVALACIACLHPQADRKLLALIMGTMKPMSYEPQRSAATLTQGTVNTSEYESLKVADNCTNKKVYLKAIEIDIQEENFDNAGAVAKWALFCGSHASKSLDITDGDYVPGSLGALHYAAAGDISGDVNPMYKRYAPGEVMLAVNQKGDVYVTLAFDSDGQTSLKFTNDFAVEVWVED